MNPSVELKLEENGSYQFTLSGVDVSIANAIRRTILSDIKVVVIDAEHCTIEVNKSRLHNEILKERLKAIPVFTKDLENFPKKYSLEVDVDNETENIEYVTTERFKIKDKETNEFIHTEQREQIFPKNTMTGFYIDFARLNPFISDTIEKEQIKLKANFVVKTAKENGCYSVVSKCAYENTRDKIKIKEVWEKKEEELRKKEENEKNIQWERRDFEFLDSQRIFIKNSFDFKVDTIGVYTNQEIVSKACIVLQNMFYDFIQDLEKDQYVVNKSIYTAEHPSTIANSYDVVLEDKDTTFGKVLEFIVYEKFFEDKKILTYVGFKKFHPHNKNSIFRIAFKEAIDNENEIRNLLVEASNIASDIFTNIKKQIL
jgi:DNA-directed RNA polymerase II subunit RPB3